MLSQLCVLQKQYGKTEAELEILVEGFSWALAEYDMKNIIQAMREYVKSNSDIPAPADIIKLIEKKKSKYSEFVPLQADLETIRRYKEIGIPLLPEQLAMLERIA